MSKFSSHLKHLIESSGETISSVARDIGAERTSIHKALTDERVLPYRVVQALAGHFRLTLEEREEFFQDYEMMLQGEDAWRNRQAICDLLNHLADVQLTPNLPSVQLPPPTQKATLIEGEYAVRGTIRSILAWETGQGEDVTLRMFLPAGLDLSQELLELWMERTQFHVEELFCTPAVTGADCAQDIQLLGRIIPLCLVSRGGLRPLLLPGAARHAGDQPAELLHHHAPLPDPPLPGAVHGGDPHPGAADPPLFRPLPVAAGAVRPAHHLYLQHPGRAAALHRGHQSGQFLFPDVPALLRAVCHPGLYPKVPAHRWLRPPGRPL